MEKQFDQQKDFFRQLYQYHHRYVGDVLWIYDEIEPFKTRTDGFKDHAKLVEQTIFAVKYCQTLIQRKSMEPGMLQAVLSKVAFFIGLVKDKFSDNGNVCNCLETIYLKATENSYDSEFFETMENCVKQLYKFTPKRFPTCDPEFIISYMTGTSRGYVTLISNLDLPSFGSLCNMEASIYSKIVTEPAQEPDVYYNWNSLVFWLYALKSVQRYISEDTSMEDRICFTTFIKTNFETILNWKFDFEEYPGRPFKMCSGKQQLRLTHLLSSLTAESPAVIHDGLLFFLHAMKRKLMYWH